LGRNSDRLDLVVPPVKSPIPRRPRLYPLSLRPQPDNTFRPPTHLLAPAATPRAPTAANAPSADTHPTPPDPPAAPHPQSTGEILLGHLERREHIAVNADLQRLTPLLEPGESLRKSLA